jgi:16S rRNA processing protein RimM
MPRATTAPAPAAASSAFVRIATVARAHGLRGQIVVDIDPTMTELVTPGLEVRLDKAPGLRCDSKITGARASGRRMVWSLAAVADRSAAEAWAGAEVLVARAALPSTSDDEYFDFELVGAEVLDADGTPLGTIREIVATGANDVLIAYGPRGEILIPATRRAVIRIDRDERRVIVDPRALVYEDDRDVR